MASPLTPKDPEWHESQQEAIVASIVVFLVVGNLSVVLRLLAQFRLWGRIYWEDYLIIFALACADVMNAGTLVCVGNGLGLHFDRVVADNPYGIITLFQYQWINAVFTGPGFATVRLSLLLFFRRVFTLAQKWTKVYWWVNMVFNVGWLLGATMFYIFQCWPLNYYWAQWYKVLDLSPGYQVSGKCDDSGTGAIAIPLIFGLIGDFALLVLPFFQLWQLQLSVGKKVGLMTLFLVGLLACLIELARIIIVEVDTDIHSDPTWGIVSFDILTCAEPMVAIMCASVPHIWSQVRRSRNRQRGVSDSHNPKSSSIQMSMWRSQNGHGASKDADPLPPFPHGAGHGVNASITALPAHSRNGHNTSDRPTTDHAGHVRGNLSWSSRKAYGV